MLWLLYCSMKCRQKKNKYLCGMKLIKSLRNWSKWSTRSLWLTVSQIVFNTKPNASTSNLLNPQKQNQISKLKSFELLSFNHSLQLRRQKYRFLWRIERGGRFTSLVWSNKCWFLTNCWFGTTSNLFKFKTSSLTSEHHTLYK